MPLIRSLAERLDQAGISWAVLRNAEGLPDFTRYDLDVLVEPSQEVEFVRMLEDCASETGWRIAGRLRYTGRGFRAGRGMASISASLFSHRRRRRSRGSRAAPRRDSGVARGRWGPGIDR